MSSIPATLGSASKLRGGGDRRGRHGFPRGSVHRIGGYRRGDVAGQHALQRSGVDGRLQVFAEREIRDVAERLSLDPVADRLLGRGIRRREPSVAQLLERWRRRPAEPAGRAVAAQAEMGGGRVLVEPGEVGEEHAPAALGRRLARRGTTDPQSSAMAFRVGKSVGTRTTTGSPLEPAAAMSALALATSLGPVRADRPTSLARGDVGGK